MPYLLRDRFVDVATRYGAALLYAPAVATDPLTNLGSLATIGPGVLTNGAALAYPGILEGAAAATLDGINDYIESNWLTRVNLCTNPSFEVNTAGWDGNPSTYINATTISRVVTSPHSGSGCLKVEAKEVTPEGVRFPFAGAAATKYVVAFYVRGNAGGEKLQCYLGEADAGTLSLKEVICTTEWQRVEIAFTSAADTALIFVTRSAAKNITWYLDDVLIEAAAAAGAYFPTAAQLTSGEAGWSGTANESASWIGPFANGTSRTWLGVANRTNSETNDTLFGSSTSGGENTVVARLVAATQTFLFSVNGNVAHVEWAAAWPGNAQAVFWALTFNEATNAAELFINGVSKGAKELPQQYSKTPGTLRIGVAPEASDPFVGSVLPFGVALSALSLVQVEELNRQFAGTFSRAVVNREFPPDKHCVIVRDPDGHPIARWAEDEHLTQNVVNNLQLSGVMPGGKKELKGVLSRDPRRDWPDLDGFLNIEVQQPGRNRIWDGRIGKTPRTDGDHIVISSEAVGWAAALEDRRGLRIGILDTDITKFTEPSTKRKLDLINGSFSMSGATSVGFSTLDPAATSPALIQDFSQATSNAGAPFETAVGVYGSGGPDIGQVLYDYRQLTAIAEAAAWSNRLDLSQTDSAGYFEGTNHKSSPVAAVQQALTAPGPGYKFIEAVSCYTGEFAGAMTNVYSWQNIRILSWLAYQNLALQGTWPAVGYTAAQMLRLLVPLYSSLTATTESVEDDGFIIQQAWWADPGTLAQVVDDLIKYGLYDWFVKGDKLFEVREPGTYGRRWQAYQGPSNFEENGEDTDRLWDRIIVAYQDTDGTTRYVGWPGSGCEAESAQLQITDPEHPAVKAGVVREDMLDLQRVSTSERAINVGERWLSEANELSRSGKATLEGYILDSNGIYRPVGQVEEGDLLRFPDARDTSYRKVVSYDYDATARRCTVDLDAPSESIKSLLERYGAVLARLGFR